VANSTVRANAPDSVPIFFVKLSELHTIRIANLRAPHSNFLNQDGIQIQIICNSAKNVDLFSHARARRRYVRELFRQIGFIKNLTFIVQIVNNPNDQISKILYPYSGLRHGGGC